MKNPLKILFIFVSASLLFCEKQAGTPEYKIIYSSQDPGDLYIMDINDLSSLKITDYEDHDGYPVCSPDGRKIAFYAYFDSGRTWSINVMKIDGSDRKRLTHKKFVRDAEPVWSPDGKRILFARSNGENYEIWLMDSDGNNKRQLKNIKGLSPCFITDERLLYNSHWDDSGEIFASDLDGGNKIQLTDNQFADLKPKLSPDGKKIAFMTNRDGNKEIYVMNADGTNHIRLTNDTGEDWSPRWSPDGEKLVFLSGRDGDYEIFIMNSDGSSVKQLTNNDFRDIQPTWLYPKK